MSVKLYGVAGAPYVQASRLGLTEKGVDFELVPVPPDGLNTPEHLARHPFAKMATLDHDGFMLYETQAILRYVDQAFPGPLLEPATPQEAARMNQIMGVVDCYLYECWSRDIVFQRLVVPHVFGRPSDEARIAAAVPLARTCAEALEGIASAPYLTGADLTLADLHLAPHFNYFRQTPEGEAILADKPKLTQWFAHVCERPSVKAIVLAE
jgi:glutathione S-transferase